MTKVVIVDNSKDACNIYADTLKCAGYDVDYITDEEKAISKICDKHPELVLLDVLMPKINGLHILEMINNDKSNKKTKVAMLTNVNDTAIKHKAMAAGAQDYIVKSEIDMAELLQRIDEVLSK